MVHRTQHGDESEKGKQKEGCDQALMAKYHSSNLIDRADYYLLS